MEVMVRLSFFACMLWMIWQCYTKEDSFGTFFEEMEHGEGDQGPLIAEEFVLSKSFYQCSNNNSCNFLVKKVKGNNFEQIANSSGLPETREAARIWRKIRIQKEQVQHTDKKQKVFKSCQDAKEKGIEKNSVINVSVANGTAFQVSCDMTTDGGGWTVFQRRKNGNVSFDKGWFEYVHGFGDADGNFWLGLERMHLLTKAGNVTLRVDLTNVSGEKGFAKYSDFKIGGEKEKYALMVGRFNGSIGDALAYSNNMSFTAHDRDNDKHVRANCAVDYEGAWWHNGGRNLKCFDSDLNSFYAGLSDQRRFEMTWHTWKNEDGNIIFSEMKLR